MSSFSSSSAQTFQEHPLVHNAQDNHLHFVNPHSHSIHNDYYLTSPLSNKPKELRQIEPVRRFSYADLLSGQETSNACGDNEPYYVSLPSSSPSNDSDDYRYSHSSGSDISTSPTNDQISFAETAMGLNHSHQQPASLSYNMSGSQVVAPQVQQQQQHRHSIATPSHFGTATPSFYDNNTQRPHRSSQPSLYDSPRNHQQQQQYFNNNNNSGMIRGYTPLPTRSLSPAHIKDTQQQQGMMNDLCFSVPPTSMFNIPPPYTPSSMLSTSPTPTSSALESSDKSSPLVRSHGYGFMQQKDEKNAAGTKKAPRSRGRRVSNIPGNGSQMFVCKADGCGKAFKRSEHLKRHIRSIHTLEKPFECPYQSCNKRFSRSDNLNQHIRIHRHSNNSKLDKQQQKQKQKQASPSSHIHNQQHQSPDNQHFASYVQGFL